MPTQAPEPTAASLVAASAASITAASLAADDRNTDQIAYWNGDAGTLWTERQDKMDKVLAPVSDAIISAAKPDVGEHVLDIGCGCGATALEIAAKVGPAGSALGVDISAQMLTRARERTPHGVPATFVLADATTYLFKPKGTDLIVSRFGVMFFAEPTRAFANIRSALKSNGRMVFACWRAPKLNPFFMTPLKAVYKHVPKLPEIHPDDPGPFALQSEQRVQQILADAGFADIRLDPQNLYLDIAHGAGLEAAVQAALEIGPAHRALTDQPDSKRAAATAEIRSTLAASQVGQTVPLGAAIWLVSARAS
jgi:ubiquinone/menaquinone biosynthesis C-methylase UbiE